MLITNGSQQGLDLVGKIFLNPGDAVCMENPSYMGAIQAFDSYQAEYVIVPMDDDGMRSEELDAILRRHPGQVHLRPAQLPEPERPDDEHRPRKILVETAQKHGVPIVEDDPYGELRFEGEQLTSLRSMWPEGVVYLGTFSKILAPGFRLGWLVAPPSCTTRSSSASSRLTCTPRPAPRWRPTRSAAATTASSWSSTSRRSGPSTASAAT